MISDFSIKNSGDFCNDGIHIQYTGKKQINMRPAGLPEFKSPPLNEVAFGVQFTPAPLYSQIHAGEVWQLFKSEFPKVAEHSALMPMFETFGLSSQPTMQFGFGNAASHDRFWFISTNDRKLVQFQQDRLHLNWRNTPDGSANYPRFDNMVVEFQKMIENLEQLFKQFGLEQLSINQVELVYTNHIKPKVLGSDLKLKDLLKLDKGLFSKSDDFALNYRRAIKDDLGRPIARLNTEVATALDHSGNELLLLNLTVRGAPQGKFVGDAIQFLKNARVTIVNEFTDITSEEAQLVWERIE